MKQSFVVILVVSLLFVLSSCKRSPTYEEMYESLLDEYFQLEDEFFTLSSRLEEVYDDIQSTDDYSTTLYLYFDEHSATYDQAYDAYESITTILSKYY